MISFELFKKDEIMKTLSYPKKVLGIITAAAIIIPGIAMGFYAAYSLVTLLGN